MKKKFDLLTYIKAFALVAVGVVIGIGARHYYHIPLADTVNIVDFAALITSIFLALFIPEVLDRRLQIRKDKKELIMEHIDVLQGLYRNVNLTIQREETLKQREYIAVRNTLDMAEHKLDTIRTLIKFSNIKISLEEDLRTITELCKEHKDLLWYDNMIDDGFSYPEGTKDKEESLYEKIDEATSILKLKLSEI